MTTHPYSRIFPGKTTAPTINDDSGDGYEVGDIWIDETNDKIYQATDISVGAAVWVSFVRQSDSTATNDFLVGNTGGGSWIKKTFAQTISILRASLDTVYAELFGNFNIAPDTLDVIASVNYRYFADISGLTADRNFKLPTPTVIGDKIELHITVGDDTYELILIGNTGISINHGSTATEWSRLFITGEAVHFVADSLTNWQVTYDGRIRQRCRIRASALQSFNDASYEKVTFSTTVSDNANIGDLTNDAISPRRAGWYQVSGGAQFENNIIYARVIFDLLLSATTIIGRADIDTASITVPPAQTIATAYPFGVGDYIQLFAYQDNGSASQQDTVDASDNHAHLELFEVLP